MNSSTLPKEINVMNSSDKDNTEVLGFIHQAKMIDETLKVNLNGISHQDSLKQPQPAGNCMNWVIGHLLWAYAYNLPVLNQTPIIESSTLKCYARDSAPINSWEKMARYK